MTNGSKEKPEREGELSPIKPGTSDEMDSGQTPGASPSGAGSTGLEKAASQLASANWERAAAIADDALRSDPDNSELWVVKGVARWQQGNGVESRAAATRATEIDPTNERAWCLLAEILGATKDRHEIEVMYERAVAALPESPGVHERWGWARKMVGNDLGAAAAYERAAELSPSREMLWVNTAGLLAKAGSYADARLAIERGLRHNPESAALYALLGVLCWHLGEARSAADADLHAAELDPRPEEAWSGAAHALLMIKEWEQALGTSRTALSYHPDSATLHSYLGTALQQTGDLRGAADSMLKATVLEPEVEVHWTNALAVLVELEDWDRYSTQLQKGLEYHPGSSQLHCLHAADLGRTGEFDMAVEAAQEAVKYDPANTEAWILAGVSLSALERWRTLLALTRRGLSHAPGCAALHDLKAMALWKLEDRPGAAKAAAEAAALEPSNYAYTGRAVTAMESIGAWQDVVDLISRTQDLHPDSAPLCFKLGQAHWQLGNPLAAAEAFAESAALSPENLAAWHNASAGFSKAERWKELVKLTEEALQYGGPSILWTPT